MQYWTLKHKGNDPGAVAKVLVDRGDANNKIPLYKIRVYGVAGIDEKGKDSIWSAPEVEILAISYSIYHRLLAKYPYLSLVDGHEKLIEDDELFVTAGITNRQT